MKTIHRALHLQHHAHTGKRLHHRHTSYRGLAIVLLLAVGFIAGLNNLARATAYSLDVYDSLYVSAVNPAPIPTTPATITGPSAEVSEPETAITGTCPSITPHVIIEILLDGSSVGSAACNDTNDFYLPITVTSGQHSVIARIHTITNDLGPDSAPFTLYASFQSFQATSSGGKTSPNPSPQKTATSELNIAPVNPFIVFGPGKDAIWQGTISGGTPPYIVLISWGDNTRETNTVRTNETQSFTHHYTAMHSYDIVMQVTDAAGQQSVRHYTAVTPYTAPTTAAITNNTTTGSSNGILQKLYNNFAFVVAYGVLIFTIAVFAILWHHNQLFIYAKVPVRHTYKPAKRKIAHSHR